MLPGFCSLMLLMIVARTFCTNGVSVTLSVQKLTFLPIPKRDHRSVMSGRTTFMTRDSWWLAISIVWLFLLLGALLLFAFA